MAKITNFRDAGDTVLASLEGVPDVVRKLIATQIATFTATHGKYSTACELADTRRLDRDAAVKAIATKDAVLDADILALADRLVAAGLGARKNPFASFSSFAPGALSDLAYEKSIKATRELVAKVLAAGAPADVQKAGNACLQAAKGVEGALQGLTQPQTAFAVAMADRDAMLPAWQKDMTSLKKHAAAAWLDHPGVWQAVFGKPKK